MCNFGVIYIFICFLLTLCLSCSQYDACESCSKSVENKRKCRWCISSSSCVSSKYLCHPSSSVLTPINCPLDQFTMPTYSDTMARSEVIFYILAANRVHNSMVPGAVESCLNKINPEVKVFAEININTYFGSQKLAALIAINDERQRIAVCFQATVGPIQFVTQGIQFFTGMFEETRLGGKMIRYYNRAYERFLEAGIDNHIEKAIKAYPNYNILTCGHSLGATMANIFSVHIKQKYSKDVTEYSLSGPRAGDETFVDIHNNLIHKSFRIIRDGDWVPDFPFRISELLTAPYHTKYEVFYSSHMTNQTYKICSQAETEACNRGSWLRKLTSHMYMFDQTLVTFSLGLCT